MGEYNTPKPDEEVDARDNRRYTLGNSAGDTNNLDTCSPLAVHTLRRSGTHYLRAHHGEASPQGILVDEEANLVQVDTGCV
jgi:hypothetical protein